MDQGVCGSITLLDRVTARPPNTYTGTAVGDVLVHGEGPRSRWPLARVESLITSPDGESRAAIILRRGRRTRRPVNKLYCNENCSDLHGFCNVAARKSKIEISAFLGEPTTASSMVLVWRLPD